MSSKNGKEETFDTIIIGSGAGGCAAAICLARAGQKVLVLEQHDVPGGWCHSFYLNGHRFSPGVHYIGLLEEGESTRLLYDGLGISNDLVFFRMNPKGFEHCWIGEERVDMPAGHENLKQALSERFPKEKNIGKYLDLVRNCGRELLLIPKVRGLWEHLTIPFKTKNFGPNALKTVKKVIDKHLDDPVLKAVLNAQAGDHGRPPGMCSFPLHCAVMDHYFEGAFYPMGGGGGIVKAMTNAIKSHGGEVRTQQHVKRILLDDGLKKKRAVGVELQSGQKILAKRVISNADPGKTFLNMVGRENLKRKFIKKLDRTEYSCTSLMLFLTLDMDVRKAGLDSGNIWLMRDPDLDTISTDLRKMDVDNGHSFPGMFISCPTLKDPPSFDGKHHTIEAITYIDYDSFKRFEGEDKERSADYLAFKDRLIEKMVNTVEQVLPDVRKHIVHKDLGTPITNEYYINSTRGSVYGTEKKLMQIGPFSFSAKTPIEELYLCGASVHAHGVAGSAYSGVETASVILSTTPEELLESDGSQKLRIYDAEDPSEYPEWMRMKMKVRRDRQAAVRSE